MLVYSLFCEVPPVSRFPTTAPGIDHLEEDPARRMLNQLSLGVAATFDLLVVNVIRRFVVIVDSKQRLNCIRL